MRVSVIISTFDAPDRLEKVLWGYAAQTRPGFEILVADDGSGPDTFLAIERLRRHTGLAIAHVWQPHQGFRKCRILNEAIRRSRGDYLIFSDGDCVPATDFVATHVRLARPGHALSGGCIRLPADISRALTADDILSGRCLQPAWSWRRGLRSPRGLLKIGVAKSSWAWAADALTPTLATFNGHNASVWRADAVRVNGFDERMRYGGLDREFGTRLENAGVRFRQVRYQALCLHLHHARPYATRDSWQANATLRRESERTRCTWTDHGLRQSAAARASRAAA